MSASPRPPHAHDPDDLNLLAVRAMNEGRHAMADILLRQALALAPGLLQVHGNLGNLAAWRQNWPDGLARYRRGIALDARNPALHLMLGTAQLRSGDLAGGMRTLRTAIDLRPGYAAAHANLGNAFATANDPVSAERHFRQAIASDASMAAARVGLARLLRDRWQLMEAAKQTRLALVVEPAGSAGYIGLASAEGAGGNLGVSLAANKRALACAPDDPLAISAYLFGLHFDPASDGVAIAEAHRRLGRRMASKSPVNRQRRTTSGPLRVGLVSADFHRTPASWFLLPVLRGRDRARWQAICYADVGRPDAVTEQCRRHADLWHDVSGWSDARLASTIDEDRIDVLFDLNGHTAGARLAMFARRAAPIQATWLGYNDTTGIPEMDFILADRVVVPPADDHLYTETVIRLRDGFVCYAPPDYAPPPSPLPASSRGFLTFGCFGQIQKINEAVLLRWKTILETADSSRLVIMAPGLGDPGVRDALLSRLARQFLPLDRVELRPHIAHRRFLESYADIDLMLDTSPYGAGTTACEALWMGVPIVTLPSDRLLGRQSASHLLNIGLPEFIARDAEDYVGKAVAWSRQLERLAGIRSELRERMRTSPLVDQARFAESFVLALEEMRARASAVG